MTNVTSSVPIFLSGCIEKRCYLKFNGKEHLSFTKALNTRSYRRALELTLKVLRLFQFFIGI